MEGDGPNTSAELADHPKYKKLKEINRGAFGVVVLAEERATGNQVAIKFIKRGPRVTKYVLREIVNHRSLIHPHIVQFKEVFLTKRCLATAMEYCNGGDMLDYVVKRGGLPETSSRWFFQQLVSAVDYLHKMGFASRDIKLDNVLLDDSRRPLMKLCDFGYSKHERDSAPGSTVGTPAYLAPEVIRASEKDPYDAKLADIWSCGVFLYASTIGTYPFYRPQDRGNPKEVQLMIQRILRLQYKIPENGDVSPELRDLLSKMLVDDPQQRISMCEIQRHPWYLTDLPEGVMDMNNELPLPGDDVQPLEDVERVIAQARVAVEEGWRDQDDLFRAKLTDQQKPTSLDQWRQ